MSVIGSHEGSGAFARLAPAALYGRARVWLACCCRNVEVYWRFALTGGMYSV